MIKTFCAVSVTVLAATALGGCSSGEEDEVRAAAQRFTRAVADQDGQAACRLLSPRTRSELEQTEQEECAAAITGASLPDVGEPKKVNAYGTSAQVRYAGETLFLSRYGDHWKVIAAGCTPPAAQTKPYDCAISGG